MSKLRELEYVDLAGLKKAAAFRGNRMLEEAIMKEMESRVQKGEVSEDEIIAGAYL